MRDGVFMKKITVIGNGVLALSVAAQVAHAGAETVYVDLSSNSPLSQKSCEIAVEGKANYKTEIFRTTSYSSVSEAEIVIIGATASYHSRVFDEILPFLKSGQTVLFFPACYGAVALLDKIQKRALDVTVCEAVSFLYVCEQKAENCIFVQSIKKSMKIAVFPKQRQENAILILSKYFDGLKSAANFLETSLDNMNVTLHPLPLLLNIASAERNPKGFYHYTEGVSPTVGRLMVALDEERMEIGKALGVNLTSAYEQLCEYYGDRKLNTMTEYVSSEMGPYTEVKGFGLDSRYIVEDVPFLLVPAISLAKKCGVKTPVMNTVLSLANLIKETEYEKIGYNFENMNAVI